MLQLQVAHLGTKVQCPSCGSQFTARRDDEVMLPPADMPDFELSNDRASIRGDDAPKPPRALNAQRRPRLPAKTEEETYAVELDAEALDPRTKAQRQRVRRRAERLADATDEDDDLQPHRGVLVLVLGILSIVLACIPLAGWILGGISMSMGSNDERLMDARAMDRSGRAMTKAGRACGIVGVFLSTVIFIINVAFTVSSIRR
jgi:hypothetical protein